MTKKELEVGAGKIIDVLAIQKHEELGWIYSQTRSIINLQKGSNPNEGDRIQKRIHNTVGGVSIIYLFALVETYVTRDVWQYAEQGFKDRMYAFLHIRNTFAHGFDGKRANRNVRQFDSIMQSNNPIKGVESYNQSEISVKPDIWLEFAEFVPNFLANVVNNYP